MDDYRPSPYDFTPSDLTHPSTDTWTTLANALMPSKGPGSGDLSPDSPTGNAQWIRKFSLVLYKSGSDSSSTSPAAAPTGTATRRAQGRDTIPSTTLDDVNVTASAVKPPEQYPGIELSALRCTFSVTGTTNSTPNALYARVYNLAPATLNKVYEFTRVQISAGYKYAAYGLIFDGTVVQYRRGKENPVDSYLEIHAGDGTLALNDATMIKQYPIDTQDQKIFQDAVAAMQKQQAEVTTGYVDPKLLKESAQRSQLVMGNVKAVMRQLSLKYGADLFIENGQLVFLSKSGYRPGETVILSPSTGLVGMPEVTPQGIQARCLLNPKLQLGGIVEISSDVLSGVPYNPGPQTYDNQGRPVPTGGQSVPGALLGREVFDPAYTSPTGRYKILLKNHSGDSRGNEWYTDLVCVALDNNDAPMVNPSSAFLRASAAAVKN